MNFLKKIAKSVYDPAFYTEVIEKPLGPSLRYFFGLGLLIALVLSIASIFLLVPKVERFGGEAVNRFAAGYPAELEVRLTDGKVSTNTVEPYVVEIPNDWKANPGSEAQYENFLVIDTKSDLSIARFEQYDTLVFLTEDSLVVRNNKGKVTIQSLSDVPNLTVNKSEVTKWAGKANVLLARVSFIVPSLIFVVTLVAYTGYLLYLFFAALLVWILSKIRGVTLSYSAAYRVSIHALTLPVLLSVLMWTLGFARPGFIFTILLLIVVWLNVKKPTVAAQTV